MIDVKTETQTTYSNSAIIDATTLRTMLNRCGVKVPDNARMGVSVPGGGDWSNRFLELSDSPIEVFWKEEQTS